jgi:pimeloyl-ACP methyl ester carboxylesterase
MDIDGPWTHEQAIVNDVRLHYVAAGDDEDPLVVLLHGFPEFWYSWRDQIPALAEAGYRVVAPDMRGYNLSEKPHGIRSYRTEELVGDVVGLVGHLGRESARVVGHDWGGVVAWEVAIRHPELVEQLAVLNAPHPGAYRRELARNPEQWKRSWYAMAFQLPWIPEAWLGAQDAARVETLFRETARADTFEDEDLRRYREAAARPGALSSEIHYYRALFRENLGREAKRLVGRGSRNLDVEVPTLLLWGEQDDALGVELTEGLDRWVSDLRVERFPEATHWVQHDEPEEVSQSLVEFFAE